MKIELKKVKIYNRLCEKKSYGIPVINIQLNLPYFQV